MGWSPSERSKRAKKCDNPRGFTMKQFCKNENSKSKKGTRNNEGKKLSSPKRDTGKNEDKKLSSPKKKEFLFNKNNPKKSFDVYIDKNPSDTIEMKYTNLNDVKKTIRNLERIYKKGEKPHSRITKNAMILKVRLRVINEKTGKGSDRLELAKRYSEFLKERTKTKGDEKRKKLNFKF